jgi:hypothetical protein
LDFEENGVFVSMKMSFIMPWNQQTLNKHSNKAHFWQTPRKRNIHHSLHAHTKPREGDREMEVNEDGRRGRLRQLKKKGVFRQIIFLFCKQNDLLVNTWTNKDSV